MSYCSYGVIICGLLLLAIGNSSGVIAIGLGIGMLWVAREMGD